SMENTASPCSASSGAFAAAAPLATSAFTGSCERFHTVTRCPAFSKFSATPWPMRPRPMKPIFMCCPSPIILHDLNCPLRLADRLARQEAGHHRLDVQDRRAVDGVKAADLKRPALHRQQPAHGHPDAVRPALAALGEDADLGPGGVAAGMAGRGDDL